MQVRPGFGPIELAWGWLMLGVLLGSTVTLLGLVGLGKLRQRATVDTLARLWDSGRKEERRQAQEDVLALLCEEGKPALERLAKASGRNEAQFLTELLNAGPPGLQLQPRHA